MIRNLADLLGPASLDKFLDHFARHEPLYLQGDPAQIGALVSLDEVNAILATGVLAPPRVRLARSGNIVPEMMYSGKDTGISAAALQETLRKGASLVIDNFGPLVPRLARLEHSIERRLQANTIMNAYLTHHKGSAFAPHYDNHEVLIVQVHGEKHWQLLGPKEQLADSIKGWRDTLPCPKELVWERTLRQGDLLYIPRGTWHRVSMEEGSTSFHLAITIVNTNGINYAGWLLDRLASDNLFAQDLPKQGGEEQLRAHEQKLRERMVELMGSGALNEYLAAMADQRNPLSSYDLGHDLELGDTDLLVSALRRPIATVHQSATGEIRAGGQSIRLTPPMEAALREIDRIESPIACGSLISSLTGRWAPDEIRAALRALARKGLIVHAA
jgi:ribosomal protein L16 Arg81 hydroxylase